MLRLLSNFKDPKILVYTFVIVILAESGYIYKQYTELKIAKEAYAHPQVKEIVREVKVKGPVQIKYRTVYEKGERVLVEKYINKDFELSKRDSESEQSPVLYGMSDRTNRWLLGASLRNWSPKDSKAYTVWGGYSLRNRLDILYGLGYDESVTQNIMLVGRF